MLDNEESNLFLINFPAYHQLDTYEKSTNVNCIFTKVSSHHIKEGIIVKLHNSFLLKNKNESLIVCVSDISYLQHKCCRYVFLFLRLF